MKKIINKENLNLISKILFYTALFLLGFIFFNILFSTTFFIFKISINKIYFYYSAILSVIMNYLLLRRKEEKSILIFFSSIILSIIILLLTIIISGKFYDYTWDGNSYHKSTIGFLIEGWNPLYEKMEEFDSHSLNPINVLPNSSIWGNHYAKASHIFAANIGIVTGNIESGKCINALSIIILFFFILSTLLYKKEKIFFSILFSITIVTCPTICAQYLTNYVDLLVYIYFFLTIYTFFALEKGSIFKNNTYNLLIYFMVLIIGINIKFSLFAYIGIYCLGYFIWYIIRLTKNQIDKKYFTRFVIVSALSVIIGLFVVGLSVYPKNYVEKGHPFYPLMGEDKIDIMTQNQPDYFKTKSPIEKFTIATFSKEANITEASKLEATYKMPFSIYPDELEIQYGSDVRISGNGIFFSGILLIAIIVLIFNLKKISKKDKTLFILMFIPIIITIILIFTLDESWWARYFPQLHLIIFFALFTMYKVNENELNILLYFVFIILLINNFLVFSASSIYSYNYTKESNYEYYLFELNNKPNNCQLDLYTESFHGALFNVKNKEKDYQINYIKYDNYINNKEQYQPFMKEFIYWRCS